MKQFIIIFLLFFAKYCNSQGNGLYKFLNKEMKYGFMNKEGKVIIKAQYLFVGEFSEGLCYVSKEQKKDNKEYKWIFIDTLGNEVIDIGDNFPETNFSNGFAAISNLTEYWFINRYGVNEFKKSWKDGYKGFSNGVAYVTENEYSDEYYPINIKGKKIGSLISSITIYENMTKKTNESVNDSKKLIRFKKNEYWGFKNYLNDTIIKPKYLYANEFSENLASVSIDGKHWGFIDTSGLYVIEPKYYYATDFKHGICAVRINFRPSEFVRDIVLDAIIDKKGNVLNNVEMHCYQGFNGDLIEYYGGYDFSGGVYYINKSGKCVIPKE